MMEQLRRTWIRKICAAMLLVTMLAWLLPANVQKAEAASVTVSAPKVNGSVVRWDAVYFGRYEQSDATRVKKDPIKWRVLSVNGNDAYLVSDTKLNVGCYHASNKAVKYSQCDLKKWIDGTFVNSAFDTEEQKAIIKNSNGEKVSLLTLTDVTNAKYGFVSNGTRAAVNTNFTIKKQRDLKVSASTVNTTNGRYYGAYWLKENANSQGYIMAVRGSGAIDNTYKVTNEGICFRPVVHLDLSSDVWSHAGKIMSNGQTAPKTPTSLKAAKANYNQANVTWAKVPEADGYEIRKYQNSIHVATKDVAGANTLSWKDTGLKAGSSYQYKIRAYWKVGDQKIYSGYTALTTAFKAEKIPQSISGKTSFTKTFGVSAFKLGAKAKTKLTYKSSNTKLATVSKTGVVTLKNPGTVKITITAAETASYKKAAKSVTIKTSMKKPTLKAKLDGRRKVKLTWNNVPGTTRYQVYMYNSRTKKYECKITKKANKRSAVHRSMKKGTYKYKVRAYRVVNGKKVYSPFSAVQTVKVK